MRLAAEEREVLLAEVAQALDHVRNPELRTTYGELLTAVDRGEVPDDLLVPLENLLEIGLETGRIRGAHQAPGEVAARRVYARTPRGQAVAASAEAVNEALRALEGQLLQELRVSPDGPGAYSISVGTEGGRLLLRVDRHGVRLRSVELGG